VLGFFPLFEKHRNHACHNRLILSSLFPVPLQCTTAGATSFKFGMYFSKYGPIPNVKIKQVVIYWGLTTGKFRPEGLVLNPI